MVQKYIGNELELFARATNWKKYYGRIIKPYLTGNVLEVGAGIGATTTLLCDGSHSRWLCLEPDAVLADIISRTIQKGGLPKCCQVAIGTLADLTLTSNFDSIIYIDVLEHMENDKKELETAKKHLAKGGYLIVLSPAHQWLFSPFDRRIGHFRRYTKSTLGASVPSGLKCVLLRYLDSAGIITSLSNRLLLNQGMPTARQILFWDRILVPISKFADPLLGYTLGKTVLGVWQQPSD